MKNSLKNLHVHQRFRELQCRLPLLQNGGRKIPDFFSVTVGLGNWNALAAGGAEQRQFAGIIEESVGGEEHAVRADNFTMHPAKSIKPAMQGGDQAVVIAQNGR